MIHPEDIIWSFLDHDLVTRWILPLTVAAGCWWERAVLTARWAPLKCPSGSGKTLWPFVHWSEYIHTLVYWWTSTYGLSSLIINPSHPVLVACSTLMWGRPGKPCHMQWHTYTTQLSGKCLKEWYILEKSFDPCSRLVTLSSCNTTANIQMKGCLWDLPCLKASSIWGSVMYIVTVRDETWTPAFATECLKRYIVYCCSILLSSVPLQDLLSNCSGIREMTRNLLTPGSPKSHVGIYGNSNPLIPSQWVPILRINPPALENQVYVEVQYGFKHNRPWSASWLIL